MSILVSTLSFLLSISPIIKTSSPLINTNAFEIKQPVIIQVNGGITEESAVRFAVDVEKALATGQPFLVIQINSYGGSVYAMLHMIDTLKKVKVPVATLVIGKAMSAGAALLTFGTEGMRFAAPNSTIMIHEVSSSAQGKTADMINDANETNRLNKLMLGMMSLNIGREKDYLNNLLKTRSNIDWFLTPQEALGLNIINRIKNPDLLVKVKVDLSLE